MSRPRLGLPKRIGLVLALFAAIIVLSAAITGVSAEGTPKSGLAISPPTFELSANPGDTLKNSLRVDNITDQPLEVTIDTRNFTALGEEGNIDLSREDSNYSLASWIAVAPDKITIPARASQTFDYTIAIPTNAAPGGRFGSIIFKTTLKNVSGQSGVAVGQEVGALVFLKISGQVQEKATIASFTTRSHLNDHGPVTFDIRIKNEGNVQFKPSGSITISNFWGKKVATIPISKRNVLPGAIRKMNAEWNTKWPFGKYNATLSVVYGSNRQVLTATTGFWGFPYRLVGIALLVLAVLAGLLYPRRTRILRAFKVLFGRE